MQRNSDAPKSHAKAYHGVATERQRLAWISKGDAQQGMAKQGLSIAMQRIYKAWHGLEMAELEKARHSEGMARPSDAQKRKGKALTC